MNIGFSVKHKPTEVLMKDILIIENATDANIGTGPLTNEEKKLSTWMSLFLLNQVASCV